MADEAGATPQPAGGGQQQVQLRIDESHMKSSYANTIRTSVTNDEVVLDFGLNLPVQAGPGSQPMMVFSVGSRVVMNWASAKRLAATVSQAVASYEDRHGQINLGG